MRWSGSVDSGELTMHMLQALVARGHDPVTVLSGICDWLDEIKEIGPFADEDERAQWVDAAFWLDQKLKNMRPSVYAIEDDEE